VGVFGGIDVDLLQCKLGREARLGRKKEEGGRKIDILLACPAQRGVSTTKVPVLLIYRIGLDYYGVSLL
jgi:hypothetical protein